MPTRPSIKSATVLNTGRMLCVQMQNADGSPSQWSGNLVAMPSISINNGPPVQLSNPLLPNHRDYVVFPLPSPPRLVQIIDEADPSWSSDVGTWNTFSDPSWTYKNNAKSSSDANASATWTFSGLQAGKYNLWATWDIGGGRSPKAVYTVYDGHTKLTSATVDQTQLPYGFVEGKINWSLLTNIPVTITGTTLKVILTNGGGNGTTLVADAIRLQNAPDVLTIKSTDIVTFSASAGWATCTTGSAGAETNTAVTNRVGQTTSLLPPFSATSKTMKVGYHVHLPDYSSSGNIYRNRRKSSGLWSQQTSKDISQQVDTNGNLTALGYTKKSDGTYDCSPALMLVAQRQTDGAQPIGMPMIKPGIWTIYYSYGGGTGSMALTTRDNQISITQVAPPTKGIDNKWMVQYNVQWNNSLQASPDIQLIWTGTTPADIPGPDFELYEPDVPRETPDNKFQPVLINALWGAGAISFTDAFITYGCPYINRSDYNDPNVVRIGYANANKRIGGEIISIEPASGADSPYYTGLSAGIVKIRFKNHHGLSSGQFLQFSGITHTLFSFTNGAKTGISSSLIFVLDPTTVIACVYHPSLPGLGTITQIYQSPGAGAWQGWVEMGAGIPLEDAIQLCNIIGANFWFNVPHAATDNCVSALASDIARLLKPGLKVILEYSNECWVSGFPQHAYCVSMSVANGLGTDDRQYYALRLGQIINIFEKSFGAASRPLSDIVRTLGTQGGWASHVTASSASYLSNKVKIDAVAHAPYLNNSPFIGSYSNVDELYDLLNLEQLLDLFEVNVALGRYESANTDNLSVMAQNGYPNTLLYTYGGGAANGKPFGSYDRVEMSHAVLRHPRFRPIYLGFLQKMQDTGVSLFMRYGSFFSSGISFGTHWADYPWPLIKPGMGDGSDTLFDNRINFWDSKNVVSVLAGVWKTWASLSGTIPAPLPTPAVVTTAQIINDSDSGFTTSGTGWALWHGQGYKGDVHEGQNPAGVATWTLNVTNTGSYRVSATWTPNSNRQTQAQYTVSSNGISLGKVLFDQRNPPHGLIDVGVNWQDIGGPYSITNANSVVTIQMTGLANGFLNADAIRLERIGDVPSPTPNVVQIVNDADPGFTTVGPGWKYWAKQNYGYRKDFHESQNPSNTAIWVFNVSSGTYRISATWTSDSNRQIKAQYSILCDGVWLSSTVVNQRSSATGLTDAGVNWYDLNKSCRVNGKILMVHLTGLSKGYLNADAIRIEKIGS